MRAVLLTVALGCLAPSVDAATFDVRAFGARGDGQTIDTAAIQAAINRAADEGGGVVEVPTGTYLAYSLRLRSNVTLHLQSGATLEAAVPSADLSVGYDAPEPNERVEAFQDFGHSHWHNSLLWGEELENVTILGPGRIFGRGLSRGDVGNTARFDPAPAEKESGRALEIAMPAAALEAIRQRPSGPFGYPGADSLPAGVGNKAIALKNCRNVIFRDFTIFHGGHFAILATGVDNWTCENLKIDTNRDGIDIDCCQNVRISNCTVNSPNDDGICPKSSYALGYPRPTENVTITNCQVSGYDEGSLLDGTRTRKDSYVFGHGPTGRIKCGTEANGGFRNITISNCVFEYCRGLALEAVDGASMEDITITNLAMRDIVNAPIFVRLGARLRGPEGTKVGTARRIRISNVVASNVASEGGVLLTGLRDYPIRDLELSHIYIEFQGGGTAQDAEREIAEDERVYPEPHRFGKLSAWGLFGRHISGFSLDHVEFRAVQEDRRPVVFLDDVAAATLDHVRLPRVSGVPALSVRNVRELDVTQWRGESDIHATGVIARQRW